VIVEDMMRERLLSNPLPAVQAGDGWYLFARYSSGGAFYCESCPCGYGQFQLDSTQICPEQRIVVFGRQLANEMSRFKVGRSEK